MSINAPTSFDQIEILSNPWKDHACPGLVIEIVVAEFLQHGGLLVADADQTIAANSRDPQSAYQPVGCDQQRGTQYQQE